MTAAAVSDRFMRHMVKALGKMISLRYPSARRIPFTNCGDAAIISMHKNNDILIMAAA